MATAIMVTIEVGKERKGKEKKTTRKHLECHLSRNETRETGETNDVVVYPGWKSHPDDRLLPTTGS